MIIFDIIYLLINVFLIGIFIGMILIATSGKMTELKYRVIMRKIHKHEMN